MGGCVACSPPAPSDKELIAHFSEHESEFNELRDMVLSGKGLASPGGGMDSLDMEKIDSSPTRYTRKYRSLFDSLGVERIDFYPPLTLSAEDKRDQTKYALEILYYRGAIPLMGHDSDHIWYINQAAGEDCQVVNSTDYKPDTKGLMCTSRRINEDWSIMRYFAP
jgi:hypothetical protein